MSVATETQPAAAVNWSELRALYVKGVQLSDLSRQTGIPIGTIKARSSREKWATTVAKAEQQVQRIATEQLADSASRWLTRLDKVVHDSLDNLEEKGVRKLNLKDLQLALDCAEKANRVARQTYGLDSDNASRPRVTVNVAVLGDKVSSQDARVMDVDALVVDSHDTSASSLVDESTGS
jgi:uncharacterized protein YjcR